MSRGIDRTELVREQLAKGGATKNTREEGKGGKKIPATGSREWLEARKKAREAMARKAKELREDTLAKEKENAEFDRNIDHRSVGDGGPDACNPHANY